MGNKFVSSLLQSPLRGLLDSSTTLVSVTGRTSGNPVTTPVNYTREGDLLWVTSQRNRQWWRNCRKCTQVKLLLKGHWINVAVEVVDRKEEVISAFEHLFDLAPRLEKIYGVKSGRGSSLDAQQVSNLAECTVVLKINLAAQ